MSRRPRKGAPVQFAAADGVIPQQAKDSILGLHFYIEARYGGIVELDLTDLQPRALAIAFAGALRRQAELGGSLGAASTIKQHPSVVGSHAGSFAAQVASGPSFLDAISRRSTPRPPSQGERN